MRLLLWWFDVFVLVFHIVIVVLLVLACMF